MLESSTLRCGGSNLFQEGGILMMGKYANEGYEGSQILKHLETRSLKLFRSYVVFHKSRICWSTKTGVGGRGRGRREVLNDIAWFLKSRRLEAPAGEIFIYSRIICLLRKCIHNIYHIVCEYSITFDYVQLKRYFLMTSYQGSNAIAKCR